MKITVVEEGVRTELELERSVVTIGRALDNDIRLASSQVSRHHCRIETDSEGVWALDLGSSNADNRSCSRQAVPLRSPAPTSHGPAQILPVVW